MRPHNRLAHKSKRRSNPRRGKRKRGKPARVYFGGGICQNGAGREAARDRPGGIRGRRGTIGGYWGGYNSLSSSPTPRALPGKVENLTPPAAGQKRTGWSTASAARATLERCQLEPLRLDQCQQRTGTGTGSRPPPPTICTGMHPAQQIAPPAQTKGQSSSAQRAAALAFFFCRAFTRLPPARPAGSADRHALGVAAVATMTTPAHRRRSRSHRLPPAPGRISTASAAPDDHASSRPPPTMTTHQRQPCPACTAPTACQPCQTSQQQRSRQRGGGGDLLCKFHVLCSFAFQFHPGSPPGLWGGAALFERCDPARASA